MATSEDKQPTRRRLKPYVKPAQPEPELAPKLRPVSAPVSVPRPSRVPMCPQHTGTYMVYNPEDLRWACPKAGCHERQYLKMSSTSGEPVVGTGPIEVVMLRTPGQPRLSRVVLRSTDTNVMVDITDCIEVMVDEVSVDAGSSVAVQLLFPGMTVINIEGA